MSESINLKSESFNSVSEALAYGYRILEERGIETARLDAQVLLCEATGFDRIALYRETQKVLSGEEKGIFLGYLKRRLEYEPVSYIRGKKEFFSYEFIVDSNVLAPRPDTELIVQSAIDEIASIKGDGAISLLEIGTGSGAITISILKNLNNPQKILATATDINDCALHVALRNAEKHSLRDNIKFLKSDLFDSIEGAFDLIVSNPPYVESGEIDKLSKEIRIFEPRLALDGGTEGLDHIERILAQGINFIKAKGTILIEIGKGQSDKIIRKNMCSKYATAEFIKDFSMTERVLKVRR